MQWIFIKVCFSEVSSLVLPQVKDPGGDPRLHRGRGHLAQVQGGRPFLRLLSFKLNTSSIIYLALSIPLSTWPHNAIKTHFRLFRVCFKYNLFRGFSYLLVKTEFNLLPKITRKITINVNTRIQEELGGGGTRTSTSFFINICSYLSPVYLFIYLFNYLSIYLSIYLARTYLPIYLSIYSTIYLFICLSI